MIPTRKLRRDVVVVGGGAAGIAAAAGATGAGASVLLAERYGFLGGAATNASVLSYCGFYTRGNKPERVVDGVGGKVLATLAHLGLDTSPIRAPSGNWIVMLEPEPVKRAFDLIVADSAIECRLHCRLVGVTRTAGTITSAVFADHLGMIEVEGSSFVDASGDADLGFLADAPLQVVPPVQRQTASMPVTMGGVDPATPVDRTLLAELASSATLRDAHGGIRTGGGSFIRLPGSRLLWWHGVDLITDGLSSDGLTAAEVRGRELAWQFVDLLKRHMPGFGGAYVAATGPQVGIRDTRQIVARQPLRGEVVLKGLRDPNGVGQGCWPAEVHHQLSGPSFSPVGGDGFFDIPLDSVRASGIENLWMAGRTIGCEPLAYGSIRVMGTAFATGQAAGVSAAEGMQGETAGLASRIRNELTRQGARV